jgi:hypothetical protein
MLSAWRTTLVMLMLNLRLDWPPLLIVTLLLAVHYLLTMTMTMTTTMVMMMLMLLLFVHAPSSYRQN